MHHPTIIPLLHHFATSAGLALVYPWVEGDCLYPKGVSVQPKRYDAEGAHVRFRSLPLPEVLDAIDQILDAHVSVMASGFVAVDLYDGCLMYDFAEGRIWLCDLDEYRPGPFAVEEERLPGSTRFMAPEEFRRGAVIDERTTVFNLGRAALVLLNDGDRDRPSRVPAPLLAVAHRATQPEPSHRYDTVKAFVAAWHRARG